MKKIIVVAFVFFNLCLHSQIKVLETKTIEKLGRIGSNDIYVQKEGDEYTIFYKNMENKESNGYKNFSFKDLAGDYENLYTIIMGGFNASPLQDIKLELPDDYVWLHYTRSGPRVLVQFMTSNKITDISGVSDFIDIPSINKLFGKI